jgi:hypothetical protein
MDDKTMKKIRETLNIDVLEKSTAALVATAELMFLFRR